MELLKVDKTPAEFPWKDIVILYRTGVSSEDKFAIDTAGRNFKGDKVEFNPWDFYKVMIRIFTVGWRGVTDNGADVPYSFDTFLSRLPNDGDDDLIMLLGFAIAKANGFIGAAEDAETKNA